MHIDRWNVLQELCQTEAACRHVVHCMPTPCSAEQMAVAVQTYKNVPMAVGKQTSLLSDECLMLNSLSHKFCGLSLFSIFNNLLHIAFYIFHSLYSIPHCWNCSLLELFSMTNVSTLSCEGNSKHD